MPGVQFSMNPSAATFGPAGMGGMMYMPGGQQYFAPSQFPQGWGGAQYGQYGMSPAAMAQAAAAAGAGGQQGMGPGGAGGMAGPQQQAGGSGFPAAAAPKPTPTVTPPRVRPSHAAALCRAALR